MNGNRLKEEEFKNECGLNDDDIRILKNAIREGRGLYTYEKDTLKSKAQAEFTRKMNSYFNTWPLEPARIMLEHPELLGKL